MQSPNKLDKAVFEWLGPKGRKLQPSAMEYHRQHPEHVIIPSAYIINSTWTGDINLSNQDTVRGLANASYSSKSPIKIIDGKGSTLFVFDYKTEDDSVEIKWADGAGVEWSGEVFFYNEDTARTVKLDPGAIKIRARELARDSVKHRKYEFKEKPVFTDFEHVNISELQLTYPTCTTEMVVKAVQERFNDPHITSSDIWVGESLGFLIDLSDYQCDTESIKDKDQGFIMEQMFATNVRLKYKGLRIVKGMRSDSNVYIIRGISR